MPYLLLQRLSTFYMPVQMREPTDVQNVENLREAGYIRAEPQATNLGRATVVVLGLSDIGRAALQLFGRGQDAPPAAEHD